MNRRHWRRLAVIAVLVLLARGTTVFAQDCSVRGQNATVRDILFDFYLWYQELPDTDPALFDSPEAYLDAVRFRPLDESFSFIADLAAFDDFNQNNQLVGSGFSLGLTGPDELRTVEVYEGSAAWDAGMRRGDFIVEVNGQGVTELLAGGQLGEALGPNVIGDAREFRWRSVSGASSSAVITKRAYVIGTVGQTRVIDQNGLPVGYINFRNFSEPSIAALDQVFADFKAQGVVDLVLDLRYNGGGLVDVATHLASLIGGLRTNAQVFAAVIHNDKHFDLNRNILFTDVSQRLDLPRVVVITSRSSASSSELVINGLRPFIPVTIVGDTTFGKPVGQFGFDFCDKILLAVAFQTVNSSGSGDFFGGFPPNCPAIDDVNFALGDTNEASLAEALNVLSLGVCTNGAPATSETLRRQREYGSRFEPKGFQRLTNNAY